MFKFNCESCGYEENVVYENRVYNRAKCQNCGNKPSYNSPFPKAVIDNFLSIYETLQNPTVKELSKLTGMDNGSVRGILCRRNLPYKKAKTAVSPNYVTADEIRCRYCEQVKNEKMFRKIKRGYSSICLECSIGKKHEKASETIDKALQRAVIRLRFRAKKRKLPFNVDLEYLLKLWENQEGLCFYTNEEMMWKVGEKKLMPLTMTVDKIIPENGYVEGNIVFCTNKANHTKSFLTLAEVEKWIPTWYEKIKRKLDKQLKSVKL